MPQPTIKLTDRFWEHDTIKLHTTTDGIAIETFDGDINTRNIILLDIKQAEQVITFMQDVVDQYKLNGKGE